MSVKTQIRTVAMLGMAFAGSSWAQAPETITVSYNGYPVTILPDDWDTISAVFVTVPKAFKITKITARVGITYPEVNDLNVFLYSPDGTRTKLLEHNCGALRNISTTFDDSAPSRFSDACPASSGGSFRPNEPLSNFNSSDSSIGVWTLAVENNSSNSRSGQVNDLTLTITGTTQAQPYFRPEEVLNSANLRTGVVSPGQVVSIFGTGLGPVDPVLTPAGPWPASLADVRVSVNGANVPIRYASAIRLDVQMPFDLVGEAKIQISYGTNVSSIVSIPVQPTFPGLFAQQSGGQGLAKALNQDGTVNSPASPARRRTYIMVYATGLGPVAPGVTAGQVPPTAGPLSVATNAVAASIGGVPAVVSYAGLAPGIVGAYQVNILVPDGVTSGPRELIISNGGTASQNGLLVQIQ
jgi:uncharacterized protein (TIGR03437 family)